jgi:hypothetical protein
MAEKTHSTAKKEEDSPPPYLTPSHPSSPSRPRSPSPSGQGQPSDGEVLDQALEFAAHPPPAYTSISRLARPVAVPQISNGISMEEFVEFIDNLNIVSTGSPPLKVIDAVSGMLGMVPYHWFALAGGWTQGLAKLGTAAVSKGRADRYMKRANEEFFGLRGLRVEIATVDALGLVLGLTREQMVVQRFEGASLEESMSVGLQERRMASVGPYISPLTFDVPAPVAATTVLEKMAERQVKTDLAKREKKFLKDRKKAVEKVSGEEGKEGGSKSEREYVKEMRKLDKEVDKINREADEEIRKADKHKDVEKAEKKRLKEMEKIEKERRKVMKDTDEERRKEYDDYENDDKEIKASKKVLWILVQNLDKVREEVSPK